MGSPPGPHSRASAAWITGTHAKFTEGADVRAGVSADQIAAVELGKQTVLPSLELATEQNEQMVGNCDAGYSCIYQNTVSWRDPTTPLPMEVHPRVVFQRLFGDGATPDEQRRHLATTGSILDAVMDRIAELRRELGGDDQRRLTQYLSSQFGTSRGGFSGRRLARMIRRLSCRRVRRTFPRRSTSTSS